VEGVEGGAGQNVGAGQTWERVRRWDGQKVRTSAYRQRGGPVTWVPSYNSPDARPPVSGRALKSDMVTFTCA